MPYQIALPLNHQVQIQSIKPATSPHFTLPYNDPPSLTHPANSSLAALTSQNPLRSSNIRYGFPAPPFATPPIPPALLPPAYSSLESSKAGSQPSRSIRAAHSLQRMGRSGAEEKTMQRRSSSVEIRVWRRMSSGIVGFVLVLMLEGRVVDS